MLLGWETCLAAKAGQDDDLPLPAVNSLGGLGLLEGVV